ncbi:uncharacterized protein L203_102541 [Cryptococcus depauperatus CBS 7841]|uniref:Uncharacterized protein n=1 Tax=Cryptococcus depauperatus CBS 7841 TaxID=1295531 RepID=A0AAJ8JRY9_9TREE
MGKQGKHRSNVKDASRPAPYAKRAKVEVTFDTYKPKNDEKIKVNNDAKVKKTKKVENKTSKGNKKEGGEKRARIPSPKIVKVDKGKGKSVAPASSGPSTFVIIAGSYEKLLYGIEGSYTSGTNKPNLEPIFIFPAHLACVKTVAASPGGKWLATGSEDEFVKVWDLRRRKEVGSLSQHTGSITSLHFPTPSHLLTTSEDSTLSLFRTSDWTLLKSLKGHSGRVNHVDVHPTGRVALSVGKDQTLKMWDLMRGRGASSLPLGSEAEQVKFSEEGTHFAVLFPKKIQIYSLTLKLLKTLTTNSRFNTLLFTTISSPTNDDKLIELLCVGTEEGFIKVYRVNLNEAQEDEDDEDEKKVAEEGKDGNGAELTMIANLVGHTNRVKSISALPFVVPTISGEERETMLLTTVSSDGFINLYDLMQSVSEEEEGKENRIEPIASYNTKGTRLTCVYLADGQDQKVVKIKNEAANESEGEGADFYGSEQESENEIASISNMSEETVQTNSSNFNKRNGASPPSTLSTDVASLLAHGPAQEAVLNGAPANGHVSVTDQEQPPLPINAPVPASPSAADEEPPSLPYSAIPSAVPTPTVITMEEQSSLEVKSLEVSTDVSEKPVSAVVQGLEPMDLDQTTPQPIIKRAGDELDDEREEKRLKEDNNVSIAAQAGASTGANIAQLDINAPLVGPDGQPLPPPAWHSYQPPEPKYAGPTTPLTLTQHKYMLNAVRSLKKRLPDAYNFLVPVDTVLFGIPHYHQVIEKPMDLSTVETKLIVSDPRGPPKDKSKMGKWDPSKGSYSSVAEVVEDVRRIWENSRKFNGKEHPVSLMASRLEEAFERSLNNLPPEPVIATPAPTPVAAAPAGPSHVRRPSANQPPVIRRTSDDTRPKREIHPPPSKDLTYEESPGSARRPKKRSDPQLQWAHRVIRGLEGSSKYYLAISPFLYPVEKIMEELPDYAAIIKRPIDLNHIKDKLNDGLYDDVSQVDDDIRLMIANALKFNPPGHEVHTSATQLVQAWKEKWKGLPPKVEARDSSEDPLGEIFDGYSSDEDSAQLRSFETQVAALNQQIALLRSKIAKRRASRNSKSKSKPKPAPRKSSISKPSPVNTNGSTQFKKQKKPLKDTSVIYRDDDYESEEEEVGELSHAQKQELAEKIGMTDGETLNKVVSIIRQTTNLGDNDNEIELDIDALPAATITRLYNLVCRSGRGASSKRGRGGGVKKSGTGRKAMGGVNKRSVDEREEAERIKRMEAQLQMFDRPVAHQNPMGMGYEEESSSEEESSEEE